MKIKTIGGPALGALAMLSRLGNARPVATDMIRVATCVEEIGPGGTGTYCMPSATLTANPTTVFDSSGSAGTIIVVEYPETTTPQQTTSKTSTRKSASIASRTTE